MKNLCLTCKFRNYNGECTKTKNDYCKILRQK